MSDRPSPTFKFDGSRLSKNDRITGVATLVLFISLFLPWFGITVGNRIFSASYDADGLTSHGYLYVVLILCLALFGYLVLRAGMPETLAKVPFPHDVLIMVVTAANAVLVILAFALKPNSLLGWRWGAFVGLIAAIVALAPLGIPYVQARRGKAQGGQPGPTA
jgi:hypothetical protein